MEELKKLTTCVVHVLPVSDDGGSTAEIVRVLGKFFTSIKSSKFNSFILVSFVIFCSLCFNHSKIINGLSVRDKKGRIRLEGFLHLKEYRSSDVQILVCSTRLFSKEKYLSSADFLQTCWNSS